MPTVARSAARSRCDEHTGTHLDAPAHFHEGGATVEAITAADLVCDAAVIDIRAACALDPDYGLSRPTSLAHEAEHGLLAEGVAVLVCTGWSAHRDDAARYVGDLRFPGLSLEAGRLLVERGRGRHRHRHAQHRSRRRDATPPCTS